MDENMSGALAPVGAPVKVTYDTDLPGPWSGAFEPQGSRPLDP